MKSIIVYYSMSGNCEWAAEKIAEISGADVLRIEPEKAYPDKGAKKFLWGGKSAVMGETPKLKPYLFDPANYDHLIIGFPVWASNMAPPLRTFVKAHGSELKNCKISAFACQGGSGAEKAFEKLKKLMKIERLEAELVLNDPKTKNPAENEEAIKRFCKRMADCK